MLLRCLAMVLLLIVTGCRSKESAAPARAAEPAPAVPMAGPVPVEMAGHIRLKVFLPLAKDVESYPRVVANEAVSNPAAQRINAHLDRMDRKERKEMRDCLSSAKETSASGGGDFEHEVEVAMRGPRYLSVVAHDAYFCGGAHPDNDTQALVYDAATGALIDWAAVLPGARIQAETKTEDASGMVLWPALRERVLRDADKDCQDMFDGNDAVFVVWLDGDRGELMAEPGDLPHVISGVCGEAVGLSLAELRKLGVKASVVDALQTALTEPGETAAKRRETLKRLTP